MSIYMYVEFKSRRRLACVVAINREYIDIFRRSMAFHTKALLSYCAVFTESEQSEFV